MTDYIPALTAILVIITGYYAYQTRVMVKEMEAARLHQFIPSLKATHTRLYLGDGFHIKISNIGMGPAKNIRGNLKLEPDGEKVDFVYPMLYPKESFSLSSPFKTESSRIASDFKKVSMTACFEDIANSSYSANDSFTIADISKVKNDEYKRDKMVDALKSIETELKTIARAIEKKK
ncbi:hypothetical protein [uncultured Methanolobus sp.]|uniref:hypothetical protein n=1 Tax=uncultured Methanolobus sp. TaxID=218300 RepID=UPI002AAB4265|nr:hypothetical protein [uncultured Methanolobus sp.]